MDLPGLAIKDYYLNHKVQSPLWVIFEDEEKEEMPIDVYFRSYSEMPELEKVALATCRGNILDIGAGAGAHTIALQDFKKSVTALEISPSACEVIRKRGGQQVIKENIFDYQPAKGYDTLLLMMNGIGLCGDLSGLKLFLNKAKELLAPNGQLLFDSCDVSYLFEDQPFPTDHYFGEIKCRYEYQKRKTDWFNWLYIDRLKLMEITESQGWEVKILAEDDQNQYLACLTLNL